MNDFPKNLTHLNEGVDLSFKLVFKLGGGRQHNG